MRRHQFALLRQRNFGLLWSAGLISYAGDWALAVALPIYVLTVTGSPASVAGIVIAAVVPRFVVGSVAGYLVDRWDRRRVMVCVSLAQAFALLPLLAVRSADTIWIVYLVAVVQAGLGQLFEPAEGALLPRLVGDHDLVAANALNSLNNSLARLVGPALGGFAAALGMPAVVLLDLASFLAAAAMIGLISGRYRAIAAPAAPTGAQPAALAQAPSASSARPGEPTAPAVASRIVRELTAGVRLIAGSRVLVTVIVLLTVASVGEGVMGALFPAFVRYHLHGGAVQLGWLMSAQAVGGLLGGAAGGWLGGRVSPVRLLTAGALGFGCLDIVIFNLPRLTDAIPPQIALFVAVGVPGTIMIAALYALVQVEVPDGLMGRVFAAAGMAMSAALLAGAVLAGVLVDRLGVLTLLTIQGGGYVVAGIIVGLSLRARRYPPTATAPEPARAGAGRSPERRPATATAAASGAERSAQRS